MSTIQKLCDPCQISKDGRYTHYSSSHPHPHPSLSPHSCWQQSFGNSSAIKKLWFGLNGERKRESHYRGSYIWQTLLFTNSPIILTKCTSGVWYLVGFNQQRTGPSKQPIRILYLSHVTSYQPIRDQYFLVQSVPGWNETANN